MLTFTGTAVTEIRHLLDQTGEEGLSLRLAIMGRGPGGFRYDLAFVRSDNRSDDDVVLDQDGFQVFVDPASAENLDGATVDFKTEMNRRGFQIDNPNTSWKDPVAAKVQRILDTRINPSIAMHGGFITLHKVEESVAYITMGGGCQGCGMAAFTLSEGIEAQLLEEVPELKGISDMTDHTAGSNPFYAASEQGESPVV